MTFSFLSLFEAMLLASSLSLDAFSAGFAYGADNIKIPMLSAQIINIICCGITGLSLFAGTIARPFLSHGLTLAISFSVLFLIGLTKLLDSITKSIIKKQNYISKKFSGSLFNFKFILHLYADPEAADIDLSKNISSMEAVLLAFSLSLDGIAVGFGAALANVDSIAVLLWSLITNVMFLLLGHLLGRTLSGKTKCNFSWLGGIILIGLSVSKLF